MGTPNKTSFDYDLNGLDVYPSLYGSSPLMSNRIIPTRGVLTSFVLPIHNQGASSANQQGHALRRKFLPATSSFFVTTLLIQTLALQHLSADASRNGHGCFIFWEIMPPFGQQLPDVGYLLASLMRHSLRLL